MHHLRLFLAALAFSVTAAACTDPMATEDLSAADVTEAAPETDDAKADQYDLSFRTFTDDIGARGQTETRVVITSRGSYRNYFGHDAPSEINFATHSVFFYSAGVRNTGGFTASLERVRRSPDGRSLTFSTRLVSPGSGCIVTFAFTKPHVLATFRKVPSATLLRSQHANETRACRTACDQLPIDQCEARSDCEVYAYGCESPPIDPDTGMPRPCDPLPACRAAE